MKTLYQSLLFAIGALALTGAAYAQVPAGMWTGNDISDGYGNTGMGTNALFSVTPSVGCSEPGVTPAGTCNTASGYQTLYNMRFFPTRRALPTPPPGNKHFIPTRAAPLTPPPGNKRSFLTRLESTTRPSGPTRSITTTATTIPPRGSLRSL